MDVKEHNFYLWRVTFLEPKHVLALQKMVRGRQF